MSTNNWPQLPAMSHERNQYGFQQQSTSTYDDNQRPSMNYYANTKGENANAREAVTTSGDVIGGFLSSQHVSELRKVLSRITGAQESRNYVPDDDEPTRRNHNDIHRNRGYHSLQLPYNNSPIKNVLERHNDAQNSNNIPVSHKVAAPFNKDNVCERRRDDNFRSRLNDIPGVIDLQGRSNFQESNNFSEMRNVGPIDKDHVAEIRRDDDFRRNDISGKLDFQGRSNFQGSNNISKTLNVGPINRDNFAERRRDDDFISRRNDIPGMVDFQGRSNFQGSNNFSKMQTLAPTINDNVVVITKSRSGDRMANEASSDKRKWKRNSDIGKMHNYQRSEDRSMMFESRRNNSGITNRNSATSFANKRRRLDHNNDERDEDNDVFSDDDDGRPKRSDLNKNILPKTEWKYPSACRDEILTHILQGSKYSSFKPHAKPKVPTKTNPIIYWRDWWAKYAYIEKKIERINDNDEYIRHELKYHGVDKNHGKAECIAFVKLACNRFQKHTQELNEDNFQYPEHLYKLLKYQILLLDLYINFPSYMDKRTCQDIQRVLHVFNSNKDKLALVHQNVICKWHSYTELVRQFENAEISLSDRVTQAYTTLDDRLFIYFVNKSIKDLKKISLNDLAII